MGHFWLVRAPKRCGCDPFLTLSDPRVRPACTGTSARAPRSDETHRGHAGPVDPIVLHSLRIQSIKPLLQNVGSLETCTPTASHGEEAPAVHFREICIKQYGVLLTVCRDCGRSGTPERGIPAPTGSAPRTHLCAKIVQCPCERLMPQSCARATAPGERCVGAQSIEQYGVLPQHTAPRDP